jgi:hypothetical protein
MTVFKSLTTRWGERVVRIKELKRVYKISVVRACGEGRFWMRSRRWEVGLYGKRKQGVTERTGIAWLGIRIGYGHLCTSVFHKRQKISGHSKQRLAFQERFCSVRLECLVSLRSMIDTAYLAVMYYRWHFTVGFDFKRCVKTLRCKNVCWNALRILDRWCSLRDSCTQCTNVRAGRLF